MSESCGECGKPLVPGNVARGLCHHPCYSRLLRRGSFNGAKRKHRDAAEVQALIDKYFREKAANPDLRQREFCSQNGLSHGTLTQHLYRAGLTRKQKNHDALVEDYWMLRSNGGHELTMLQIAAKLGVSGRTLSRALRKVDYGW